MKDETIADGTHVQPGTRLIKRWVMLNSGDQPWDSNTKVRMGTLQQVAAIHFNFTKCHTHYFIINIPFLLVMIFS